MRKPAGSLLILTCLLAIGCTKTEKVELAGVEFTYTALKPEWMDSHFDEGRIRHYTFTNGSDHSYIQLRPYYLPLGSDTESLRQAPIFKGQSPLVPTTVEGQAGLRVSFKRKNGDIVQEVLWNQDGRTMEARMTAAPKDQAQVENDFRALLSSIHTKPLGKVVTNQDVQKLNLKWAASDYARSRESPYRSKKIVIVDREARRISGLNQGSSIVASQPSDIGTAVFVSFNSGQQVGTWSYSSGGSSSVVRFNVEVSVVDLSKGVVTAQQKLEAGGSPDSDGPEMLNNIHKVVFEFLEGLPEQ